MAKRNPHIGSNFDDFLKEEGIFDKVQAKALKRALAEQIQESSTSRSSALHAAHRSACKISSRSR
jgi:antitoxin HicB